MLTTFSVMLLPLTLILIGMCCRVLSIDSKTGFIGFIPARHIGDGIPMVNAKRRGGRLESPPKRAQTESLWRDGCGETDDPVHEIRLDEHVDYDGSNQGNEGFWTLVGL